MATAILAACDQIPTRTSETPETSTFADEVAGIWAATPDLCQRSVWSITASALTSDSGVICALDEPRPNAGGWTANATCARGQPGPLAITPTPGRPRTLVLSGRPFARTITLVQCGAPGTAAPRRDPHALLDAAAQIDLKVLNRDAGVTHRRDASNAIVRDAWWMDGQPIKIVEPSANPDGPAARVYYFRPGSDTPFLVRTRKGSLGYADGRFVTAYSQAGERLDQLPGAGMTDDPDRVLQDARLARRTALTLAQRPNGDANGN